MVTFDDLASEIIGTVPLIPAPYAGRLVNKAFKFVCQNRLWSWLVKTGDILAPSIIKDGSVTATSGSADVVVDSTAAALLNAVVFANPPLASTQLGIGRQFRVVSAQISKPIYSIVGWDSGTNTLTLDRPYAEPSAANAQYVVYKCYYAPPTTDWLRYLSLTNVQSGYNIRGRKLYYNQSMLNSIDPQRGATGDAYIVASFKPDSSGREVTEWYPHPQNLAVYNAVYATSPLDMSGDDQFPQFAPTDAILSYALVQAGNWALANIATYPALGQSNWVQFSANKMADFRALIIQAIKDDDERAPLIPAMQGSVYDFPLGGQFLQGHDISQLLPGNQ